MHLLALLCPFTLEDLSVPLAREGEGGDVQQRKLSPASQLVLRVNTSALSVSRLSRPNMIGKDMKSRCISL
jgi:hypothetical protein